MTEQNRLSKLKELKNLLEYRIKLDKRCDDVNLLLDENDKIMDDLEKEIDNLEIEIEKTDESIRKMKEEVDID